jgi:CheY-like chemotaxis protein
MPSSQLPDPPVPATGVLPLLLALTQRPQTMLLVEDSRFAAEAVRLICRAAGIRLRRAETLAGARAHLRAYRPELALVDLGLPDGSGLELIAELNALSPRRPRIVATSGEADGRCAALAAGADAFCAKPLDLPRQLEVLIGTEAAEMVLARMAAPRPDNDDRDADPMALQDDLKRAHGLLLQRSRVAYAGQFVAGIARDTKDAALIDAAELARYQGRCRPLRIALTARLAAGPSI